MKNLKKLGFPRISRPREMLILPLLLVLIYILPFVLSWERSIGYRTELDLMPVTASLAVLAMLLVLRSKTLMISTCFVERFVAYR